MIADPNEPNRFTDKQTDKRVHELLSNEKDTVSENDISNIQTDVNIGADGKAKDAGKSDSRKKTHGEKAHEVIKDDSNPEIDTVWNMEEGDN